MAISSIGIGSGLPLDELLHNLRTSENQSLALIESRAKTVQSRLSGYGTIKSSIDTLKIAAEALGKADTFGALKTNVGGDFFTATASSKAISGQYNVEVKQLASSQTLTSAAQATRTEKLATGDVNIEIELFDGSSKVISVSAANATMEGIAKAINNESGAGVNATMLNDGTSHYMLLNAKGTGEKAAVKAITVTAADPSADPATDFSKLTTLIGLNKTDSTTKDAGSTLVENVALNSRVLINTIEVTGQTNTIEGAIEGITLTLSKTNELGKTSALSVTRDDTVASKAIDAFISAYNNLQGIIKALTSYNVDNQTSSALTGDNLARNVQNQVRNALNVAEGSGAIHSLAQLGITTNPTDGTLKVDGSKLSAALKSNLVDVQALFTGDKGISKQISAAADTFVKSGGLISSATDGMTTTLKNLEKQYNAESGRIDAKMENYRKQFSALDSMMAQMKSVSSYLTQQLSMLGNLNERK